MRFARTLPSCRLRGEFNIDDGNNKIAGTIDIENGVIDRTANTSFEFTYSADINGTLTQDGDSSVFDGVLDGDYTGTSYQYAEGFLEGTATTNGDVDNFIGAFVGER